jgi:PilZ domain
MEKRRFSRTGFHTAGEIEIGGKRTEVEVVDLSLKGALFESEDPFAIGETAGLEIKLSNSDLSIRTEGKIVHAEENHYGIRFFSIDAESMIHLRSLMEYNTENYERIGSELAFLYKSEE